MRRVLRDGGRIAATVYSTPERNAAVWDQIEAALTRFETPQGYIGPCELLVGSGTK